MTTRLPLVTSEATGLPEAAIMAIRQVLASHPEVEAAILYGSTETTFYVLTVYFGSVGIRRFRHALLAGLTADLAGMIAAVFFGRLLFALV